MQTAMAVPPTLDEIPTMTAKADLRKILKNKCQAFVKQSDCQDQFESGIARTIALLSGANCIAGYVRFGCEVCPQHLLEMAAARGIALALPHIGARGTAMTFKTWQVDQPLYQASFGFLQPAQDNDEAAPDTILVPLVGFDRQMNRLGQGAGHYDRIFPLFPNALRIGLGWSCQEIETLPADPWDVPLDGVLTEKEWVVGPKSRIAA